jgi:hypothetical protein
MKQIVLDLQTPQIVELDSIGLHLDSEHFLIGLEEADGRRFIVKQNNYFRFGFTLAKSQIKTVKVM